MKRSLLLFGIWLFLLQALPPLAFSQNLALNTTGNAPDVSAMLDIVSSNKGLLLPRVALTTSSDATTVPSPATSLMVYNTNASMTGTYADGVGYYFNAGTTVAPSWRKLAAGGDIRWDDLRVTLDKGNTAATLDYFTGSSGPEIWWFKHNAADEAMTFTVQLPHAWKEGSDIFPHIHWVPKSTGSGNVEWLLDYAWANNAEVFPAITTLSAVSTGSLTAKKHTITSLAESGISGTGKTLSSILICRIWRNGSRTNDTYNDYAGALYIDFHIQIDGFGSRQEYIK